MSINKAEKSLGNKLVNDIDDLKRQMIELKALQPIGGDVLRVTPLPVSGVGTAGPIAIGSSTRLTIRVTFTPDSQTLTIWNVLFSLRVDTDTSAYHWPLGDSLSEGQKNLNVQSYFDWEDSDDTTNIRTFYIVVVNSDSISHDLYLKIRSYIPSLGGSVG